MPFRPRVLLSSLLVPIVVSLALSGCASRVPPAAAPSAPNAPFDVRLQPDEADAAMAILDARMRGSEPSPAAWTNLFASEGYRHLMERETAMHRTFTDSSFRAFLLSDTLLARAPRLAAALPAAERIDVTAAARRALAYLPAGTRLRSRLYLEIKPITNSFVFTGRDSIHSIFLYVDPDRTPAQLENVLAHELHHIGLDAACGAEAPTNLSPARRTLLRYLSAFGEGQAMLAAAGGADVHPHAVDPDSIRRRWDRDVATAARDVAELSSFFGAVVDGRIASADSVAARSATYFGVQGPWYTVGWLMASTIERERGRAALIGTLCDPTAFLALYDDAARDANRRGATLPLWDEQLIASLVALSHGR